MAHWSDRHEGGNRFWLKAIRWSILHIGRSFTVLLMYPAAAYFFFRRGAERRASRTWLERVEAPQRGIRGVVRHIRTFAVTTLDRALLLSGRDDELDIRIEGLDGLRSELETGQGVLLLGSHLGSFELMRALSRHSPGQTPLRVVMDRQHNSLITQVLEELDPGIIQTVIDARQHGTQIVLEIAEAIGQGQIVAMLGDRAHRNEPVGQVSFLGRPAPLPVAPLAIARSLEVPVFLVFGLYEGGRRYRMVFERFPAPDPACAGNRRQRRLQLDQSLAHYARRLEHFARQYPYNWFNFYDFWNPGQPDAGRRNDRQ